MVCWHGEIGILQYLCCSEGGFFNAILSFPADYPQNPPTCKFTSDMWHPNGEDPPPPRLKRECKEGTSFSACP